MSAEGLVRVHNLVKTYRTGDIELHALRGVSLTIDRGDFVAIMGASGSGKSTFMNILGCLDIPTSGEYFFDSQDVLQLSDDEQAELRNKKFGFIFQSFNILSRTSALANVELPLLYNKKMDARERRDRAYEALASVGLSNKINSMPNQLSGGQQQRVAIARALVNKPLVILADEPTGNLDSRTSYEIMGIFQELNEKGITIIMVTHEPDISQFAKRGILFRDGKIIADHAISNRKNAVDELKKIPVTNEVEVV